MDLLIGYRDVYNCIAKLAYFVNKKADIADYVSFESTEIVPPDSYLCLDAILNKRLNGILYNSFGTLTLDNNRYLEVSNLIQLATDELVKNGSLHEIFIFLQVLDKVLFTNIISESWKEELGESQYLNSNERETGFGILPFYHCGWDLSSERINRSHDINVFVRNFLIVNLNNLSGLDINHFFVDSKLKFDCRELRVGLSPLWKWVNFEYDNKIENGEKIINIKHNSDFLKENEMICKIIDKATKEKVDILLFPELLGNDEMKNVVRKKLLKSRCEFPKLIVLPSVWKDGRNTTRVVNRYGIEIFEQGKRTPYIDKKNYRENLKVYRKINVMHVRGFGRILIMICRDFLEVRELQRILDELRPTMIMVPSFSTGYHDFDRVKGICEAHECVVVWVNSCAGGKMEDPIGFIDKAGHSFITDEDRLKTFFSCEKRVNGCCEELCLYTDTLINPNAMKGADKDG